MEKAWNALKEFAWPFGLCGGAFAIGSRFMPDAGVSLTLYLATITIFAALSITLIGYSIRAQAAEKPSSIRIEQVVDFGKVLLLAKSEQLGVSMGAQVFYREGSHERMIGQGQIINVQQNGMSQLEVKYLSTTENALLSDLSDNKRSVLDRIVIKPGVIMNSKPEDENAEESI